MMSGSDDPIDALIESCFKVKSNAYCPYSKFPVGAAVLCKDGTIFAGCNVENAAYPLGVCAENTAISKAVSEGHTKFKAIAVCSDLAHSFITPCGSCRQILAEFGMDWDVYMTRPDRSFLKMKVRELLPLGFTPDSMEEEKVSVTTDHMPPISKIGQVNGTGTLGQVSGTSKVGQVNVTKNGTDTEHRNGDVQRSEVQN